MTVPGLAVTEADGVLTIRFDRPEVFNALTGEMTLGTAELLERASARDDVRVVVLTGTGPAFSTGADIGGEDAHERFDVRALDAANRLVRSITACDKPVVAGVNGIAAGVGLSAALACDLAVCAESASLLLAFARVGLMPDGGATATVAAAIGRPRAMRMALLARSTPRPCTTPRRRASGRSGRRPAGTTPRRPPPRGRRRGRPSSPPPRRRR